jgi:hypothetical protein
MALVQAVSDFKVQAAGRHTQLHLQSGLLPPTCNHGPQAGDDIEAVRVIGLA